MSNWTIRTTRDGIEYGGYAGSYYWDPSINPNANSRLCLANCTTYAFGRIKEAGDLAPVGWISDANTWHTHLINGWTYETFNINRVEPGDILEWAHAGYNHVAVVEYVSNGIAYYSQSSYTTRNTSLSLQQISNYFIQNYPSRFYSNGNTGSWQPTYILKNPAHHSGSEPGPGPGPEPPAPEPDRINLPTFMAGAFLLRKRRKNRRFI